MRSIVGVLVLLVAGCSGRRDDPEPPVQPSAVQKKLLEADPIADQIQRNNNLFSEEVKKAEVVVETPAAAPEPKAVPAPPPIPPPPVVKPAPVVPQNMAPPPIPTWEADPTVFAGPGSDSSLFLQIKNLERTGNAEQKARYEKLQRLYARRTTLREAINATDTVIEKVPPEKDRKLEKPQPLGVISPGGGWDGNKWVGVPSGKVGGVFSAEFVYRYSKEKHKAMQRELDERSVEISQQEALFERRKWEISYQIFVRWQQVRASPQGLAAVSSRR